MLKYKDYTWAVDKDTRGKEQKPLHASGTVQKRKPAVGVYFSCVISADVWCATQVLFKHLF